MVSVRWLISVQETGDCLPLTLRYSQQDHTGTQSTRGLGGRRVPKNILDPNFFAFLLF